MAAFILRSDYRIMKLRLNQQKKNSNLSGASTRWCAVHQEYRQKLKQVGSDCNVQHEQSTV